MSKGLKTAFRKNNLYRLLVNNVFISTKIAQTVTNNLHIYFLLTIENCPNLLYSKQIFRLNVK